MAYARWDSSNSYYIYCSDHPVKDINRTDQFLCINYSGCRKPKYYSLNNLKGILETNKFGFIVGWNEAAQVEKEIIITAIKEFIEDMEEEHGKTE